jgi:hypothetical protein
MATIREWETEVKRLSPLEAERKLEAIQELLGWEFFKEQYDGLGLPVVEAILKNLGQIRIEDFENRKEHTTCPWCGHALNAVAVSNWGSLTYCPKCNRLVEL